jgi:hypothetical protein
MKYLKKIKSKKAKSPKSHKMPEFDSDLESGTLKPMLVIK